MRCRSVIYVSDAALVNARRDVDEEIEPRISDRVRRKSGHAELKKSAKNDS